VQAAKGKNQKTDYTRIRNAREKAFKKSVWVFNPYGRSRVKFTFADGYNST
jgi:hypothetical protein